MPATVFGRQQTPPRLAEHDFICEQDTFSSQRLPTMLLIMGDGEATLDAVLDAQRHPSSRPVVHNNTRITIVWSVHVISDAANARYG